MSGQHSEKAARITGCVAAADPTMRTGGWRIALTGAAQSVALPTAGKETLKKGSTLSGRFVRLLAVGANVQFAQGRGSAPVPVLNQASVMGTGHVGFAMTLANGVPEPIIIDTEATHFGWVSDAAAGFLEMVVADAPVP
jgi:hypothetical protein